MTIVRPIGRPVVVTPEVPLRGDALPWDVQGGGAAASNEDEDEMPTIGYIGNIGSGRYYLSPSGEPTGDQMVTWVAFRSMGERSFTPRVIFGSLDTGGNSPLRGWGWVVRGDSLLFRAVDNLGGVRTLEWYEPTRVHGHWVVAVAAVDATGADFTARLNIACSGIVQEIDAAAGAGAGGALTDGGSVCLGGAWDGAALVHPATSIDVAKAGYSFNVGAGSFLSTDVELLVDGTIYDPDSNVSPAGGGDSLDLFVPSSLSGLSAPGAEWGGVSGSDVPLVAQPLGSLDPLFLRTRTAPRWV